MANYLVAGAAGFIGSRISAILLEQGHTVIGVDNLNDSYDPRVKRYRLEKLLPLASFHFYQKDICHLSALQDVFAHHQPVQAVLNLAARAGVRQSVQDPWGFVDTNITGTLNLLECCRKLDVPKFVFTSTSGVYGANPPLPTPETSETEHPLQPYAASKRAAELMCHAYHSLYGLDVTIFRFFSVYGPYSRPDMVMFRFIQWISEGRPVAINGDGMQTRAFTHLEDVARGTLLGLKPLGYEILNLGGHESIAILDLARKIEALVGRKADLRFCPASLADARGNQADVAKATRLLGWRPAIPLEQGLASLVDWYNAERAWTSKVLTP